MRFADCHLDRKHRAHGMCDTCYFRENARRKRGSVRRRGNFSPFERRIRGILRNRRRRGNLIGPVEKLGTLTLRILAAPSLHRLPRTAPPTPPCESIREWWKSRDDALPKHWRLTAREKRGLALAA
jgi:hypothetical protein